ncbi:DNA-binding protein [Halorientalis brevis]|uniref:DNA-binding protein n=1 Tax=Halorientalis brevis TaxID=1126241 RepID=A0ABD6CFY7_9EURY|nr:DNA-binding protein [Halorientalis brevis]
MNSNTEIVDKDSVDVQHPKYRSDNEYAVDEDAELRPTVELESQGKVDTNHPEAQPESMTLEGQERFEAREQEIRRTRQRLDRRLDSDREHRTRRVAADGGVERRREFQERAASVAPSQGPDDPRTRLSQTQLAAVNQKAARLDDELDGWTRAAISRRLAKRVVDGADVQSAALKVVEACQKEPGTVIPIRAVSEVDRARVSIEGRVSTLWESSHPAIRQVGLIEDDTDRIKWTSWAASRMPIVEEGDTVLLRNVAKNWYQGRCSVALTGDSHIAFPEDEPV